MTTPPQTGVDIATTVAESVRTQVPALPQHVDTADDLAAYGLNSMKAVDVLFALEDAFDVTIDEDEVDDETFSSIDSIVNFLIKDKNVAER